MISEELLEKATRVVCDVKKDVVYIQPGVCVVAHEGRNKVVQVFVERDLSLSVYDLLDPRDREAFEGGELLVAIISPLGENESKALLRTFGF